ncbi:hypothetical protein Moror_1523 [Moniliophthora roreri MCA 2997]|uniref:Uncharacterized protein n=1 Tax=Moniliophthora roreri (strain MCA 2997) TaxID=1381753 RepID=V2XMD1_MONRO|nr:hypothetical protein Moror_1523 [Moniliophthora roreri MCA 2997]
MGKSNKKNKNTTATRAPNTPNETNATIEPWDFETPPARTPDIKPMTEQSPTTVSDPSAPPSDTKASTEQLIQNPDPSASPKDTRATTEPSPDPTTSPAQTVSTIFDDTASHHSHITVATMIEPFEGKTIISPEIKALGELLGTMKLTVSTLGSTFAIIGKQTEKVAALAPAIKASEEIDVLREKLAHQMATHKEEIIKLRAELKARVKEAIRNELREQALMAVKDAVGRKVSTKVADLLLARVPEDLKENHHRQLLEISTNIYNTEARRFNSSLQSSTDTLRPLRRPLSSPGQLAENQVLDATPATAVEIIPPTPSANFPKSLGELYTLSIDDAKELLREYGIKIPDSPKMGLTPTRTQVSPLISPSSAATLVDVGEASREQIINMFMAHIGVRA